MRPHPGLERLPPLPDSAQKVVEHLLDHEPMTGKDLREATGLPRRTIYSALVRLRELGILREQPSLRDTRQRILWVDLNEAGRSENATAQSHDGVAA